MPGLTNLPGKRDGFLKLVALVAFVLFSEGTTFAQCSFAAANCQANMTNGTSANFNALTWTNNSGPACPVGGSTSYGGNLLVTMANNTNLTISANFTVNGDFNITNTGSNSTLTIPVGVTLRVTGDLGDCTNNNVNFVVNGTLIVDGYISGKNSNSFAGTGSITATGGLNFNTSPTCTGCTITWNVGSCVPAGAFCTLPISLLYFKGDIRNNEANLTWATESEKNFDYFTIEKSADGENFEEIAQVKGQGNSFQRVNYQYSDPNLMIGKTYYRLKETDFDGHVVYFNIISVNYSGAKAVLIYPVPVTNGILNLKLNFASTLESHVTVTDILGTVLAETTSSEVNISILLQAKSGIYLVKFVNGDFSVTKRFMVN